MMTSFDKQLESRMGAASFAIFMYGQFESDQWPGGWYAFSYHGEYPEIAVGVLRVLAPDRQVLIDDRLIRVSRRIAT